MCERSEKLRDDLLAKGMILMKALLIAAVISVFVVPSVVKAQKSGSEAQIKKLEQILYNLERQKRNIDAKKRQIQKQILSIRKQAGDRRQRRKNNRARACARAFETLKKTKTLGATQQLAKLRCAYLYKDKWLKGRPGAPMSNKQCQKAWRAVTRNKAARVQAKIAFRAKCSFVSPRGRK